MPFPLPPELFIEVSTQHKGFSRAIWRLRVLRSSEMVDLPIFDFHLQNILKQFNPGTIHFLRSTPVRHEAQEFRLSNRRLDVYLLRLLNTVHPDVGKNHEIGFVSDIFEAVDFPFVYIGEILG